MSKNVSRKIAYTGIFTALVAVTTMVFQIYIPSTKGYFNIGETMVYISALLLGPYIGAFAGGVGSAIADIVTGYFIYAPATLVIKGIEGFIVGFLANRNIFKKKHYKILTLFLAIIISVIILLIGLSFYTGEASITLSLPSIFENTFSLYIPEIFWIVVSISIGLIIFYIGINIDPDIGWIALSIMLGGCEMVLGYFIYERFILGYYAFAEIPFNIAQAVIGLIISIFVYRYTAFLWKVLRKI